MLRSAQSIPRQCRQVLSAAGRLLDRGWLSGALAAHVACCPRCRGRVMGLGRVAMGLSLMRSLRQPRHLLGEANRLALQKMQRAVRLCPEADELRTARVRISPWPKVVEASQRMLSAAACLAVLFLLRWQVSDGARRTVEFGEKLAAYHEAEHIYGKESDWA